MSSFMQEPFISEKKELSVNVSYVPQYSILQSIWSLKGWKLSTLLSSVSYIRVWPQQEASHGSRPAALCFVVWLQQKESVRKFRVVSFMFCLTWYFSSGCSLCEQAVSSACRLDRKKDKAERKILDSQERAFWDVHRPVVKEKKKYCMIHPCKNKKSVWHLWHLKLKQTSPKSPSDCKPFVVLSSLNKETSEADSCIISWFLSQPGCVNTTEMDIRKCRREKNPHRVKKVTKLTFYLHFKSTHFVRLPHLSFINRKQKDDVFVPKKLKISHIIFTFSMMI